MNKEKTDLSKEEQASLELYLSGSSGDGHVPNQEEKLEWLRKKYQEIKVRWLVLTLQRWEAEGIKSDPDIASVLGEIQKNMKARAWVCKELKVMGEEVKDPFEPLLDKCDEEAAVDAYAEGLHAGVEAAKERDHKSYCEIRYDNIKKQYKDLLLQKAQAEGMKASDVVESIQAKLRTNFKQRLWVVKHLRRYGVRIEDPFVPESTI